jgi:ribosomal protein L40E
VGGGPVDEKVVDMAVICPICGAENPDSAEYCNLCLGSVGFNASDCVVPVPEDKSVYHNKYPSSFHMDSPEHVDDEFVLAPPKAKPADVGTYGERTGYRFEPSAASGPKRDDSARPSIETPYKKARRTR